MPALFQNKSYFAADASVLAMLLALASIHVSPAIASVGLALALLGVWMPGSESKVNGLGLGVALSLLVIEVWGSSSFQRLGLHLPFYAAMVVRPGQSFSLRWIKLFYQLWWAWALPLIWVSLASLLEFAQHPEFYRQMVMESKPMPLFSQVYHIEYSVIQAVLLLLLLKGLLAGQLEAPRLAWGAVVLMMLCLHALSARTGILTFWVGVAGLCWPYRHRLTMRSLWLVPAVLLLLSLGTMRERLSNSWKDLLTMVQQSDPNHQSMAQRWEAWKAASNSLLHKPVLGWGSGHTQEAMAWSYQQQTRLHPDNWIGPHNQYLELALQGGFLTVLLTMIWMMDWMRRSSHWLWTAGLALAMVFESLAERQAGVLALVLVLIFVQMASNERATDEKSVNEAGMLDL
jgi:O-antigen ligase